MAEHENDADIDPLAPAETGDAIELTPLAEEDVTWESVLTGEEVEAPAGASGDTEELVGVADPVETTPATVLEPTDADDFMGFEENVSVTDTDFSRSRVSTEWEVEGAGLTTGDVDASSTELGTNPIPEESYGEDATQVLRRSLIQGDDVSATVVEATSAATLAGAASIPRAAATFEEAMSTPTPPITFEAEALPVLPSRALPRFLAVLFTLLFTPIAWYLLADAAARLAFAVDNPMVSGIINVAAIAELFASLIAITIIAILAAQSSLGLIITGTLVMLAGAPFLFVPALVGETGYWGAAQIADWNDFGGNIANHFLASGFTGLLFAFGFLMLAFGWVIAAVRRAGRNEEALRISVSTTNPTAMRARWARKATEKAQRYQ